MIPTPFGQGHNTRLLAQHGARLMAVDISQVFVKLAMEKTGSTPGICYQAASAVELPFASAAFDFATGFMSFMDIAETGAVLGESYRVLKPGGYLQFSITHPCFDTPHRRNLRDDKGLTYAIEVGGYFDNRQGDIAEWLFSAAPPQVKEALAASVPFPKRLGNPDEYARLAMTMIETGYFNGEDVRLDGAIRMAPR